MPARLRRQCARPGSALTIRALSSQTLPPGANSQTEAGAEPCPGGFLSRDSSSNPVKLEARANTIGNAPRGGQLCRDAWPMAASLRLGCGCRRCFRRNPGFAGVSTSVLDMRPAREYVRVEALRSWGRQRTDIITNRIENVAGASAMILAARRPVLPEEENLETRRIALGPKRIFVERLGHRHPAPITPMCRRRRRCGTSRSPSDNSAARGASKTRRFRRGPARAHAIIPPA